MIILERSNLSSKSSSGWKFGFYQPNLPDGLGWSGGGSLGCLLRCGGALRGRRFGKLGVDGCGVDLWFVTDITILNQDYYF